MNRNFKNTNYKTLVSSALIAASTLTSPLALAEKGQMETSVAASIDSSKANGQSSTMTYVIAEVGRYFTPKLVGKVNASVFGFDSGGTTSTTIGVGAGAKYYFGESAKSKFVPFVLGDINVLSSDSGGSSATGYGLEGGGGVAYFVTEDVSMDLSLKLYTQSFSSNGFTYDQSGQKLLFGITARY